MRLRSAAAHCGFGNRADEEIVRQMITGCVSMKLREHLLKSVETDQAAKLKQAIDYAKLREATETQSRAMGPVIKTEPIAAVRSDGGAEALEEVRGRRMVDGLARKGSRAQEAAYASRAAKSIRTKTASVQRRTRFAERAINLATSQGRRGARRARRITS